jgi:hypothetical protein
MLSVCDIDMQMMDAGLQPQQPMVEIGFKACLSAQQVHTHYCTYCVCSVQSAVLQVHCTAL